MENPILLLQEVQWYANKCLKPRKDLVLSCTFYEPIEEKSWLYTALARCPRRDSKNEAVK
jgi:hypothetical protein